MAATHQLFAHTVTLDSSRVDDRPDTLQAGALLGPALSMCGDWLPAGTWVEFLTQSTVRATGEKVFGVRAA